MIDMKRVEQTELNLEYAKRHQALPGRWADGVEELIQTIKQQQEQIERYEEALKYISGDVNGHVYADSFDEAIQASLQALEES